MYDLNQRWKHKFEIKPGKWVHVPTDAGKKYGALLNKKLRQHLYLPDYCWHLKHGGHVKALKAHTSSKVFASLDLSGFFTSITRNRVIRSLKTLYGYEEAREIATRSTVWYPDNKRHVLPFGFAQSTLLATICLTQSRLGAALKAISRTPNLIVSVYVDDIVISGPTIDSVQKALDCLAQSALDSKFNINDDKLQQASTHIDVFNIRLGHNQLRITDDRIIQFQTAYSDATSEKIQKGILAYIGSVNRSQLELILPSSK
jgi:hypothetical protein